jgi:hypothetical protein
MRSGFFLRRVNLQQQGGDGSGDRRLIAEEEAARKQREGAGRLAVGEWGEVDPKNGNRIVRFGQRR